MTKDNDKPTLLPDTRKRDPNDPRPLRPYAEFVRRFTSDGSDIEVWDPDDPANAVPPVQKTVDGTPDDSAE